MFRVTILDASPILTIANPVSEAGSRLNNGIDEDLGTSRRRQDPHTWAMELKFCGTKRLSTSVRNVISRVRLDDTYVFASGVPHDGVVDVQMFAPLIGEVLGVRHGTSIVTVG